MYPYGVVYKVYREHTREDIRKNLKSIRELGMNFIVVWPAVFWWEDQTLPGYPYDTGRFILQCAAELGLQIIMETAGQLACLEYAPDFAMKDDYYVLTKAGTPSRDNNHYYFGYINYFHPEVREMIEQYLKGIVQAYKDYPALYGYDIWNETMFESHDEHTWQAFRQWLKNKYGTISQLNNAWESTFSDWSQPRYSQLLWASVMPFVDYKAFHKDSIGLILQEWKGVVKSADPLHPVIADNIHSMVTENWSYDERAQDDWVLADSVDEMGISFYPKGGLQAMDSHRRWLIFASAFAASRYAGFWVSEMQSHHQAMFNPFSYVHPYELKWWNFEAISHGAKGIIYWKWNNFSKGLQTFGRGLVDSSGAYTPRALAAGEICRILSGNQNEFSSCRPMQPRVAILFDRMAYDFTKAFTLAYAPKLSDTIYIDAIAGLYHCLWEEDIAADIIRPADVLDRTADRYNVLFVSGQLNLSGELAQALVRFTEQGGVVISDGKFGEIGDDSLLHPQIPGGLTDVLGFTVGDMEPENLTIQVAMGKDTQMLEGYYERRDIRLINGRPEILGTFADGRPAVLRTAVGGGAFIHMATLLWYGYQQNGTPSVRHWLKELKENYPMSRYRIESGEVKAALMTCEGGLLLFVFNYQDHAMDFAIRLPGLDGRAFGWRELFRGKMGKMENAAGGCLLSADIGARDVEIYKIIDQDTTLTERNIM